VKVLVTGHKGYIGTHVYRDLKDLGHEVVGIDLKEGKDIMHCLPNESFDYVFHLAAMPSVQFSVEKPTYTMRQNVLITSKILEWAKDYGVKRIIFSSSAAAVDCVSPYGLHKRMSEMECKLYSELYGLDTVCLRYFNVYSEDQPYGGSYSTAISSWMQMARQDTPMRIDGDGEQTRDFVHVSDVVNANIFCMQSSVKFGGEVMDVGSGRSVSINSIKDFLYKRGYRNWKYSPTRIGDARHSIADLRNISRIGWEPEVQIIEGLNKCFK